MIEKNPARTKKVDFLVTLKGIGGHSSKPHIAKNPVLAGFELLHLVQNKVWWSFSQFENVVLAPVDFDFGTKQNIIPESGSLKLSGEYSEEGQFDKLKKIVEDAAEAIKVNYGVNSEITVKA